MVDSTLQSNVTSNFIDKIWAAEILKELRNNLVFGQLFNRNYQGTISKHGDTVYIGAVGDIEVRPYTTGMNIGEPQLPEDSQIELKIDQGLFFNFKINNVVEKQSIVSLKDAYTEKAAYNVANRLDQNLAAMHIYTPEVNRIGSDEHPVHFTSAEQFYNVIAKMQRIHSERNTPKSDRYIVIPPVATEYLVLDTKHILNAAVPDVAKKAVEMADLGRKLTYEIYETNNVSQVRDGNTTIYKIMAFQKQTFTLAEQLTEFERLKSQTDFAEIMRGLLVYGTKAVYPETCVTLTAIFDDLSPTT